MIGEVLDSVLFMISGIIGFKRHAVIAHSIYAMLAKA